MTVTSTTAAATPVTSTPRRPRRWRFAVYATLAPVLATLAAFQYYPAVSGIWHSFFDWKPVGHSKFVGLANYRTMLDDDLWWTSFRNLAAIFVFGVVMWTVPLLAAELLISLRNRRLQFFFRTLLIVPMAFPGVVTALVWSFMYHPNQGIINQGLSAIGLSELRQNWVGNPDLALISLLFIGFPFVAGLPFLIIYSSLSNIPAELFEAAEIDGVGRLRRVWTIDLPLLAAQIKLLFFLAVVATLQYGFMAYIVTAGGPDGATSVPVLRMLDVAYQGGDWGHAAALSTTLFVITLALSCVVVFVRRRNSLADAKGM
ncbi:carbohydrate ABC transporter permease [Kribbella sp. NPDC054772]